MERNFRKRQGRFIKKNDSLLDVVVLRDFSFEAICDHAILQYDNPNRNVIYARYHESDQMTSTITSHKGLETEVREQNSIPDILQPIDFTVDWRRQQERASKRKKGRSDDDEESDLDMDLTSTQKPERQEKHEKVAQERPPSNSLSQLSSTAKPGNQDETGNHVAKLKDLEVTTDQRNKQLFTAQKDNLDSVGKVIQQVADSAESPVESTHFQLKQDHKIKSEPDNLDTRASAVLSSEESAILDVYSPEFQAMEQYREVLNNPDLAPSKILEAIEEAKAQGYQDGYMQGEEKASLQLKAVTRNVTDNVQGVLEELENIRKTIIAGAEKNFQEVCQALAQALLQQELTVSTDAFTNLVQQIVREHVGNDKFKVAIHPEFHAQLKKMNIKALDGKIIEDADLAIGSFRVESQQAVVDGNLQQMIADLLKQADLKLFKEDEEKAS